MDETENYLNSILQKRIGSVVNTSAFTKNGNTVARLPQQEEKIESMPTVFRKKHETVYMNSQAPSYKEARGSMYSKIEEPVEDKQPTGSHRVEYMAISKRIEKKKDGELISPTVDVTKYRVSNTIVREKSPPIVEEIPVLKKISEKEEEIGEVAEIKPEKSNRPKRRRIFEGI